MISKSLTKPTKISSAIQIGFHIGNTLMNLAKAYAKPGQVLTELVQNAIDANAINISIKVDGKQMIIYCADDGDGETYDGLLMRFAKVCEQQKTEKIGHKGMGNLASLAISDGFSFTTRPKGDPKERFFTVTLSRKGLETMANEVKLPCRNETEGFRPGSQYKLNTDFAISTLLIIKNVRKVAMQKLEDAATAALEIGRIFSSQIVAKKLRIFIEAGGHRTQVRPQIFSGEAHYSEIETKSGKVVFEIYVLSKKTKTPRISVIHGKTSDEHFALPISIFLEHAPEIRTVFESGFVEGKVFLPFCSLTPDREGLEYNDELLDFLLVLEDWAKKYGLPIIEKISYEKKEIRINKVLQSALNKIEGYLKGHEKDLLPFFKAQVSEGHFEAEKGELGDKLRSKDKQSREKAEPKETGAKSPEKEKKGLVHSGFVDSTGSRRRVASKQFGLVLEYRDPLPSEDWKKKCMREGGKIIFNSLHNAWKLVEGNPELHLQYCFHLILKELIFSQIENEISKTAFSEIFEFNFMDAWIEIATSEKK